MQFDEEARGFSFSKEGPLDMRMDSTQTLTARDIVNKLKEDELGKIFRELGEEPFWRKASKAIVESRKKKPFVTTKDLSTVIEQVLPRRGKIHPATRIFQAIRMYINKELESVEGSIKKAIQVLSSGGKIGVLSFHSLEDRLIKNIFRNASKPLQALHDKDVQEAVIDIITKKPRIPTMGERRKNRRSRSAKLRFAVKR